MLKVGVIADSRDCCRRVFWCDFLAELRERNILETQVEVFHLADRQLGRRKRLLRRTPEKFFLERLQEQQVLIINWDAINGDPEFGADYALYWFENHWAQIAMWIADKGGVLLLEGQAVLSVPVQRSYDALLGHGDLVVSGAEDPLDVRKQRVGDRCRMTKQARSSVFSRLLDLRPTTTVTYSDLFPGPAARAINPSFLGGANWNLLYRGWFRWDPLRRRRLDWVPLIRTADRRINHDTMRVARYGYGAIFSSTMFLAGSGQVALVEAILRVHGQVDSLPAPRRPAVFFRRHFLGSVVPILAGGIAGAVGPNIGTLADVDQELLVIVGGLAFWALAGVGRAVKRLVREMVGW